MINGEDTREESSGVPSLDLSNPSPQKLGGGEDASPASSLRYSSCGESEFERYCSANSVMGTPSMCSSMGPFNDCVESEFGSLKGGFVSGDATEFENFSLGPSLKLSSMEKGRLGDQGIGFSNEGTAKDYDNERISMACRSSIGMSIGNLDSIIAEGTGNGQEIYGNLMGSRASDGAVFERDSTNHLVGDECQESLRGSDSLFGGSDMGREDVSSLEDEHSDGDDSICGTDDGCRNQSYYPQNAQYRQKLKAENDNPFLINSSTAFGSDDWDDFELETRGGGEASLSLYEFQELNKQGTESKRTSLKSFSVALPKLSDVGQPGAGQDQADKTVSSQHAQDADGLKGNLEDTEASIDFNILTQRRHGGEVKDSETVGGSKDPSADVRALVFPQSLTADGSLGDSHICNDQTKDTPLVMNYLQSSGADDIVEIRQHKLGNDDSSLIALNTAYSCVNKTICSIDNKESIATQDEPMLEEQETGIMDAHGDLHANCSLELLHQSFEYGKESNSLRPGVCTSKHLLASGNHASSSSKYCPSVANAFEAASTQSKTENLEPNDFYDDFVHDMEEILLDSGESSGARFSKSDKMFQLQLSLPRRDGGQTATTSGLDDSSPIISQRLRIDGVEVVGAKQKKGDVSLSERLVGVREYTVYIIRVWSGKDKWEVERRYRDFYTLYRRLTLLFADQGWTLPSPWASVERESRKIFGTSPAVIAERSVLIQECLNSVLQSRCFPVPPNVLHRFLSPQDTHASSSQLDSAVSPSGSAGTHAGAGTSSTFGNTISLIVEVRNHKSVKQLLEAQHYVCAGCHRYFDDGVTLVRDFVKALGWGKPRLCEYTGQLFCSSCHTNETAVLPARVLHHWDFSRYPVSQLAKSYLDSIHEQPMLCVSAVNPFLFSKVPALNHVMNIRKRIGTMLPYVRCPFRKTLNKGLRSRRYLLESTDFFALRDLIDLSKGAFAALPVIIETVSRKILEHVTEQCLVCCDVGVPCNARQACDDPSSLIFPFQEDEVSKCPSCGSVFHKKCFTRLSNCHCGTQLGPNKSSRQVLGKSSASASVSPVRFLSALFSKTNKDNETVILMGSMPSSDL